MTQVRSSLLAFASGRIKMDDLVAFLAEQIGSSLASADLVMGELEAACDDKIVDQTALRALKRSVITAVKVRNSGINSLNLDRPDQTVLISAANRGALSGDANIKVSTGMVLHDRYYVDEVLGVGGMGTIFKGRDILKLEAEDRNPFVAIKVLNENIRQRPDAFISLQREASRQQRLAHPNIATVYHFDRVGGTVFITMELLEGKPLDVYLKQRARNKQGLPLDEALPLIRGLCEALAYAHDHRIIHSDFKPSNCFITEDGNIKVLDFGIARAVRSSDQPDQTKFDGGMIGALTPAYASLEMLEHSGDPDPADDVYALACVAYEILSNKHPFNRLPANAVLLSDNVIPKPLKCLSRSQNRALKRGLALHREQRTPTVRQFLEEFDGLKTRKFSRHLTVSAVAAVLVVSIPLMVTVLENRKLDRLIESASSTNLVEVADALTHINELDPDDRLRVLNAAQEPLSAYFANTILAHLMTEDFSAALSAISQARTFYPDSARIEAAATTVGTERGKILAELGEKFDNYLSEKRLLPTSSGEDLPSVIETLKQMEPDNVLITDVRLADTYATEIGLMLADNRLADARVLLDVGQLLAPGSIVLINAEDRLNEAERIALRDARIVQLEESLSSLSGAALSLVDVLPLRDTLLELERIDSQNSVLADIGNRVRESVASAADALQLERNVQAASVLTDDLAPLSAALGLTDEYTRVKNLFDEMTADIEQLAAQIADSIRMSRLDSPAQLNATDLLSNFVALAPADDRADDFRQQIIDAYIGGARDYQMLGQWEQARAQLAFAERLAVSSTAMQLVQTAQQALVEAERVAGERIAEEQEARETAERTDRILRLESEIIAEAGLVSDIGQAQEVIRKLNDLAGLAPNHELLRATPDLVAQRLAVAAIAAGSGGVGGWEAGRIAIERARSLFPNAIALDDARTRIDTELANLAIQEEATRIADLRERLDALVANAPPQPDDAWVSSAVAALTALVSEIPSDDVLLAATMDRLAQHFVAASTELRRTQRYSLAHQMLTRADQVWSGLVRIQEERSVLTAEESAFEADLQAERQVALVESHKQAFRASISARDPERAGQQLSQLQVELSPDDLYISTEALPALAQLYLDLIQENLKQRRFSEALAYAQAGLRSLPDNADLQALSNQAKAELEAERRAQAVVAQREADRRIAEERAAAERLAEQERITELERAPPIEEVQARTELDLTPPLAITDLQLQPVALTNEKVFGTWCAEDNSELSLNSNELIITMQDGGIRRFAVLRYEYSVDNAIVTWVNPQLGEMVMELGNFTEQGNMIQIRGREARKSNWDNYNRNFKRCG